MGLGRRSPSKMSPGGIVKARKEHVCRCGTVIRKGDRYHRSQALPFERPFTDCMDCFNKTPKGEAWRKYQEAATQ